MIDERIRYCRGCGDPCGYTYCDKCSKLEKCAHGNIIAVGCDLCDYESDMAYNSDRESR